MALAKIDAVFLTHYHSDHTSGIPDLWLTGWLPGFWGRRTRPFHVIGPLGAKSLMSNLEKAYALDIKIRLEDEKLAPALYTCNRQPGDHHSHLNWHLDRRRA